VPQNGLALQGILAAFFGGCYRKELKYASQPKSSAASRDHVHRQQSDGVAFGPPYRNWRLREYAAGGGKDRVVRPLQNADWSRNTCGRSATSWRRSRIRLSLPFFSTSIRRLVRRQRHRAKVQASTERADFLLNQSAQTVLGGIAA
jgi:hypothetical protein